MALIVLATAAAMLSKPQQRWAMAASSAHFVASGAAVRSVVAMRAAMPMLDQSQDFACGRPSRTAVVHSMNFKRSLDEEASC